MIFYKVSKYSSDIEPVEVFRATEKSLYIKDPSIRRVARQGSETYFPSETEAIDFLRARLQQQVKGAHAAVLFAQEKLVRFEQKYGNSL